jgi:Antitoxin Phd_YefM, type II toxin-antitoxin system
MILQDGYVSISDIRDKTSQVIKSLDSVGTKIVLSQNKPVGVFLSIEKYNNLKKSAFLKAPAYPEDIAAYKASSHGVQWIEAFSFLASLK